MSPFGGARDAGEHRVVVVLESGGETRLRDAGRLYPSATEQRWGLVVLQALA